MSKLLTSLIEQSSVSVPDRRFWGVAAESQSRSTIRFTYSIGLWDLDTYKTYAIPNADPAAKIRGTDWFQFPVPPQTYELSEIAATSIVPTQGGGKFVESQGSIFKDIRLTGTVGLRPSPVDNNILPEAFTGVTGLSLEKPKVLSLLSMDERGLPSKEITGFDDITFLRNIFRGYWDLKKKNSLSRRIVMVWIYAKDSDCFIVEPINFTATKDKGNPFSYNYSITLRTLYRFDVTIKKETDLLSAWNQISNLFSVAAMAVHDITAALNFISSANDFIVSLPLRVSETFSKTFIEESIGLIVALTNLKNTGERLDRTGRQYVERTNLHARELRNACAELESGISIEGSKSIDYSLISSKSFPNSPPVLSAQAIIAMFKNKAVRAATLLSRTTERILATDSFFETTKQVVVNDQKIPYNRNGPTFTAGSPLNVNNVSMPSSAYEITIGGNATLRSIAKQILGDESYWKMLAIANNLKPPYIASTSGDGILAYGDKILIPKIADSEDFGAVSAEQHTDALFEELSPMVKKYGRDIKLSSGSLGTDYADFEVSQRGDLATIDGVDNVRQALVIKTSTEQGELSLHPTFGAAYPVGSKVGLSQLQEFALNTRRTLLDDHRINSINQLKTYYEGDVIRVYAVVSLRQSDVQLPVEFTVRSL